MPTFAQSAAAREARWTVIWTIEGSGNYTGLYRYCTQIPDYAAGDAQYRDWALEWPHIVDEQIDEVGGIPDSGEIELKILDYNDTLTSEWRIEADPVTYLNGDHVSGATTLTLDSYSSFTSGSSIAWVGNEIYRITSGAGPFTVTPGWLDSDTFKHFDGDPVFAYTSYLHERRVRVYLAPIDAASASEEREFGSYVIDYVGLTEDLCGFVIRAKAQAKWLNRVVHRRPPYRWLVTSHIDPGNVFGAEPSTQPFVDGYEISPPTWNSGPGFHIKNGDEVAIAGQMSSGRHLLLRHRGQLGTIQQDVVPGNYVEAIWAADPTTPPLESVAPTFFRYSAGPTPSTTEASGWTPRCHWIDLVLNLATSSADVADGLRFNNRDNAYGAWDCLPIGLGIGIPHRLIDLATAVTLRAQYPDQLFPDFWVGSEPVEFGELISHHFLRPLGAYISMSGGIAKIVLPRFPKTGSSSIAIGNDEVLRRRVGEKLYAHDMRDPRLESGRVTNTATVKFSDGTSQSFHSSDFGRSSKQTRGYYATEEKPLEIEAPSLRPDRNGVSGFMIEALRQRFLLGLQPRWDLEFKVDISQYDTTVGSLLAMTHSDMPDFATGVRGWTAMVLELLRRVVRVTPEKGAIIEWGARAYGSGLRIGRIAPSARIVSVANAGSGTPDVTVSANRYTQTDAQGLPLTDAAAFAVNDVVRIRNRNGTTAGGTTATISGISGNVLTLSNTFSGTLTNGTGNAGIVIDYATRANAVAQQYNFFVFWADQVAGTVGASTQSAWKYA